MPTKVVPISTFRLRVILLLLASLHELLDALAVVRFAGVQVALGVDGDTADRQEQPRVPAAGTNRADLRQRVALTGGRKAADARAKQARAKGLPQVGVLDSSSYASLHPGYWVVFSGIYGSEAEATSALEAARKASKTAAVRHVVA